MRCSRPAPTEAPRLTVVATSPLAAAYVPLSLMNYPWGKPFVRADTYLDRSVRTWYLVSESTDGKNGVQSLGELRLIPLKEARERFGISKATMARLVKEQRFRVYENPLDRRQKLVDLDELSNAVRPHPTSVEPDVARAGRSS